LPKQKKTRSKVELKVDRDFDPAVLQRAREITMGYRLMIQPADGPGFIGRSVELPGVMAGGMTHEECVRAVVAATETAVATLLEMGQEPPVPASAKRRTEQINIRLTSEEKLLLEEESQRKGFRGISDFVRAAVLNQA
jgi:predicted RNase H-like HicB family nuclease